MSGIHAVADNGKPRLEAATAKLSREFGDALPKDTIESYLSANHDELAAMARFDHFVPLLAERQARRELRHIVGDRP